MSTEKRWPQDPNDVAALGDPGKKAVPVDQLTVDPGESAREKLLEGARTDPKGPDKGIPRQ